MWLDIQWTNLFELAGKKMVDTLANLQQLPKKGKETPQIFIKT